MRFFDGKSRVLDFLALERNIQVLSLRGLLISIGQSSWNVLLPLYFTELDTPAELIGIFYSSMIAIGIFASIIGGYLSDRIGRKPLILGAGYAQSLLVFSYSMVYSWYYLMPLMIVGYNILTMVQPASVAITAESIPHEKRATAFSVIQTFSLAGGVAGPSLGGIMSQSVGFRTLFCMSSGLWLISTILAHLSLTEKYEKKKEMEKKTLMKNLYELKRHLQIGWQPASLMIAVAVSLLGRNAASPYEAIYAEDYIKMNRGEIGLAYSSFQAASAAFNIPAGKLADKVGRKRCLIAIPLLYAPLLFAFILSSRYYHVITIFALMGIADSLFVAYPAFLSEMSPKNKLAYLWGLNMTIMGVGSSLGSALSGIFWALSPRAPFYVSAVASILSSLLLAFTVKETMNKRNNHFT